MSFLFFILSSVGLCYILVDSVISSKMKSLIEPYIPQWLMDALNCPQCMGWWVGALVGIFLDPFEGLSYFVIRLLCYGFVCSIMSVLAVLIINRLNIWPEMQKDEE